MCDYVVYNYEGEAVRKEGDVVPEAPTDAVLYVDSAESTVSCRFGIGNDDYEGYVDYYGAPDLSLETFVECLQNEFEEAWKTVDESPNHRFWVFQNLAEAEPKSLTSYRNVDNPLLEEEVIEHAVDSKASRQLDGDFDPHETILVGTQSYKRAVEAVKNLLSRELVEKVAIVQSADAASVEDVNIALVSNSDFEMKPLNPRVLENAVLDRAHTAIQDSIEEIENDRRVTEADGPENEGQTGRLPAPNRNEKPEIGNQIELKRLVSLSTVRTRLLDETLSIEPPTEPLSPVREVEEQLSSLPERVLELVPQAYDDLHERLEEGIQSTSSEAAVKYFDLIEDHIGTLESSVEQIVGSEEAANRLDELEAVLYELEDVLYLLEALDGDSSPSSTVGGGLAEEDLLGRPVIDSWTRVVRGHDQLRERCVGHDLVDVVKGPAKKAMQDVADAMADVALSELEAISSEASKEIPVEERYRQIREAHALLAEITDVSRFGWRYLPEQLGQLVGNVRFSGGSGQRGVEPSPPVELGDEPLAQFVDVINRLDRHAHHGPVADVLDGLEDRVRSKCADMRQEVVESVSETAISVNSDVSDALDAGVPVERIATAVDDALEGTPLTVALEQLHWKRQLLLIAAGLFLMFSVVMLGLWVGIP